MPVIPIRDMVGGGGAVPDVSPDDLPPNSWSKIVNARFARNRIERIGGNELFQNSVSNTELTNSRVIWEIIRSGSEGILLITSANIYVNIGVGWVDVTPVAVIVDSKNWIVSQYGDWIIITTIEGVQEPLVLKDTGSQFIPFAFWTSNYQAVKIFPYKNFLIAVGIEISNNEQNGLIIWSDVVNEATLDQVSWDAISPTTLAGENILPSSDGLVRDGGVLRDSGILYTDTSVWRMDVTNAQAGVSPLVFNFRKIFDDDGIFATRCFTEVNGRHYVVGIYDIYLHDGFNKKSISDNKYTETFFSTLGTEGFAFMAHYQRPQEIIICYTSLSNTEADTAIVYNYFYNTWTAFDFSLLVTHLILAPEFSPNSPSWADLQTDGTLWSDLNTTSWNDLFPQNRNRIPYVLVPGTDSVYFVDRNTTTATAIDMLLERLDLDLDEVFGGSRNMKYIKRFMPMFRGDGIAIIQFGGRENLGSPVVWQPEFTYNILTDYKMDLRMTHRYPAIRIYQRSTGNALSMTGYDLEISQVAYR